MKLLGQLTDDRFHEAAGARELLDDPGGTRIGHVRPQRGLQIDADGRQFGLKKGANTNARVPGWKLLSSFSVGGAEIISYPNE